MTPTASTSPKAPSLSARGRRLWREMVDSPTAVTPAERVLIEEACRAADRLDALDRILRGHEDAWMSFRSLNEDGSIVQVVLNSALSEARQQQVALKQLLGELRQIRNPAAGKTTGRATPTTPVVTPVAKGDGVVDFASRVAELKSQAAR